MILDSLTYPRRLANAFNPIVLYGVQKQQPTGVLKKRCSENMQQIYRRAPMPKCDFNKAALLCNFIEIALRHRCSLVNLLHIFRHLFLGTPLGGCFWA